MGTSAVGLIVFKLFGWPVIARVLRFRKRLIVTRENAVGRTEGFGLSFCHRTIGLTEILRIYSSNRGPQSFVVIEGQGKKLRIGELDNKTATWLAKFATAAVVAMGSDPAA